MNDKLLMDNMILLLKSTSEVYLHGVLESSNKSVRELMKTCLAETLKLQEELYNKMVEYEMYNIQNIDTKNIKQALKKINKN